MQIDKNKYSEIQLYLKQTVYWRCGLIISPCSRFLHNRHQLCVRPDGQEETGEHRLLLRPGSAEIVSQMSGKQSDLTFTFKLFLFVGASLTAANQWRDGQAAAGAGETERPLLCLWSGAAFVGRLCYIRCNKAVPIWRLLQRRPTNGTFISWIWRLHQMDPAWPSLSHNTVWPGFLSVWDDEMTMGGTSCHHQLMRQKLMHGQLMMQLDIFLRLRPSHLLMLGSGFLSPQRTQPLKTT